MCQSNLTRHCAMHFKKLAAPLERRAERVHRGSECEQNKRTHLHEKWYTIQGCTNLCSYNCTYQRKCNYFPQVAHMGLRNDQRKPVGKLTLCKVTSWSDCILPTYTSLYICSESPWRVARHMLVVFKIFLTGFFLSSKDLFVLF